MSGREPFETGWTPAAAVSGLAVQVGQLVALADQGATPMVIDPSLPLGSALRARSIVDLHADHIGTQVLLVFEGGDPAKPIVIGVLRGQEAWPLRERPDQVQVDADGQRLVVSAQKEMVLRCGKASITLTRTGEVFIEGSYVSTRSTGVNRIRGGSVQLN
ncbi:MAG: hypothetical protein J7598_00510 [Mitsuaria chitosanitabida]|uniref:DUF6484 domain-containing protein n=1 Tax=Roseateles chitosanitabidus TaxID=65048 RepID=UPI001B25E17A|nr:DUF6484 domain-containing protein [Roseateles chitosanitabidus]MBO9685066.1 hypothetical protein [Roseateles chitosanitabidus]